MFSVFFNYYFKVEQIGFGDLDSLKLINFLVVGFLWFLGFLRVKCFLGFRIFMCFIGSLFTYYLDLGYRA